jgi:4-hydroxyphenylpyruvate dioxygenase
MGEGDLAASGMSPREAARVTAGLGLKVLLYQPLRDCEGVPPSRAADAAGRAARAIEAAAELGAPALLACSNATPGAVADDGLAAAQLAALAEQAAACRVRVAYEALAWGTRVRGWRHAWRLVQAAAHGNLGLCVDSFHVLAPRHDHRPIAAVPGDRIFFLQLADAPLLDLDPLAWSRHYRCLPGQGSLDVAGLAASAAAAGYRGPWSLEVFSDALRQASPARAAAAAMRSLSALEAAVVSPPASRR